MSSDDGFKRKNRRMAAIEAAKRIKMNADANTSLSGDENENHQFHEAQIVARSVANDEQGMRGRKRSQVSDTTVFLLSEVMRNLSKNIPKFVEANPSKCEDMPKKRRGRPPKSKSAKNSSMRNKNTRYKDPNINSDEESDNDVNLRRESYNISQVNKEIIVAKNFCGPQQLQVGNRDISYRESLMKFSKDLGPTARKVADQKLQKQTPTYQPRHWLEPLLPSAPDPQPHPHFMDISSFNGLVRNTRTNQVNQPLISFDHTNSIASYKGKKIMVDDGKPNCNKWDVCDNLEFLFGKGKGGVKIGNGSSENQDFIHKNLGYGFVGNRGTINQTGSFFSNYNGNLNHYINKIPAVEDVNSKKEVSMNSFVYPATYLPPSRNVSSSYLGFDGGGPLTHDPPPVQPPGNWCLQPPATKINSVVNDDLWKDQDLQLALALNMQMSDQESNIWTQSLWAPASQPNQFLQPDPLGPDQEQPLDNLLMPMPMPGQSTSSQMTMIGDFLEQDLLTFDAQNNFGLEMGNNLLYPPPGI